MNSLFSIHQACAQHLTMDPARYWEFHTGNAQSLLPSTGGGAGDQSYYPSTQDPKEVEDVLCKRELSRVLGIQEGFFEASALHKKPDLPSVAETPSSFEAEQDFILEARPQEGPEGLQVQRASSLCPEPGLLILKGNESRYWFLKGSKRT